MTSASVLERLPAARGAEAGAQSDVLAPFVQTEGAVKSLRLLVEGVHCAGCIRKIETGLLADPAISEARVNLSLRRLNVSWTGSDQHAERIGATVRLLGYGVAPYEAGQLTLADARTGRSLLRALAIAGFASSNVMMLSWAVWAGHTQGMPAGTHALFQWLSAIVAIPAIAVAGQTFFRSAWQSLRSRHTNIDVPISAGLLLTLAISVMELLRAGPDVYFDSAAMLLFVLLVGRYLDFRVRARARAAIEQLVMLKAETATVRHADGHVEIMPAGAVEPGMTMIVRVGERVPADGVISEGPSELDVSIVTGESLPLAAEPGQSVLAGSLNRGATLAIAATKSVNTSHLAEILRLVEQAELRRGPSATLADRVARVWTPVVHGIAFLTFLGWWLLAGADVPAALLYAVSVLIIACPCAIGLAVPAVQVVTIGALLKRGILLKSGDALERLAKVDLVAFDKTGTLSRARPEIIDFPDDPSAVKAAVALAAISRHPLAGAIYASFGPADPMGGASEIVGQGVEAPVPNGTIRLGKAGFCGVDPALVSDETETWLTRPGHRPARFVFADLARPDAADVVAYWHQTSAKVVMLSGDKLAIAERFARTVGVDQVHADLLPAAKSQLIDQWQARGDHVLMVGDGLNDAPALSTASVSASFAHAASVSQSSADIVLPAERLDGLVIAHRMAKRASAIIRQNLGVAALYNLTLIPVAISGHATPLVAALAMSASSLAVTLNALRAGRLRWETR